MYCVCYPLAYCIIWCTIFLFYEMVEYLYCGISNFECLISRWYCLMILYSNLTNSERLLLSLELFLIFPSSMSSHNQTCWRDLKRNQCYRWDRLSFGLVYYIVDILLFYYTMEYLCGGWYSLTVLYSKLLNPESLLPSWNSSLYSPSSISPIVVQAIWSGYLSKGSQGESDAVYGVCYIWCMLSNGLLNTHVAGYFVGWYSTRSGPTLSTTTTLG